MGIEVVYENQWGRAMLMEKTGQQILRQRSPTIIGVGKTVREARADVDARIREYAIQNGYDAIIVRDPLVIRDRDGLEHAYSNAVFCILG
jgi:hypothetical protein